MNYFAVFSLPLVYSINLEQLTCRYYELQRKYHPDRLINKFKDNKETALQQATVINIAYQVLKHPLERAEYMLSIYGINVSNEQYIMHNTEFLMQQFALREELAVIEVSEQIDKLLLSFSSNLSEVTKSYLHKMEKQMNNKQWMNAADTIHEIRFFNKLQQKVEELEERVLNRF